MLVKRLTELKETIERQSFRIDYLEREIQRTKDRNMELFN